MAEEEKRVTRGEKRLLIAIGILVAVLLLGILWLTMLNAMPPTPPIPTSAMPASNARDFFLCAYDAIVDRNYAGTSTPMATMEASVRKNGQAIALLRQGLAHEFREQPVRSFHTSFENHDYYRKYRSLAKLLQACAKVETLHHRYASAVEYDLDAMQLGVKIVRGAPVNGRSMGSHVQTVGQAHLWQLVDYLTAPETYKAVQRLRQISASQVANADTLQEEKWYLQASLLTLFKGQPYWRHREVGMVATEEGPFPPLVFGETNRRIFTDVTRLMDDLIAQAKRPYSVGSNIPISIDEVSGYFISESTVSSFINAKTSRTDIDLLTLALTLHAYKQEHSVYPADLQTLVPAYLNSLPDDPFTLHQPFHYKRKGALHMLYSVGPNGKDDGGIPKAENLKENNTHDAFYRDPTGDIVAGVNMR